MKSLSGRVTTLVKRRKEKEAAQHGQREEESQRGRESESV